MARSSRQSGSCDTTLLRQYQLNIRMSYKAGYAHKSGELNDYSVHHLESGWRQPLFVACISPEAGVPAAQTKILALSQEYKPKEVVIEDNSGTSLIQDLSELRKFKLVPFLLPPSGTDKIMRLVEQSDVFETGRVFANTSAPVLQTMKRNYCLSGF